MFKCTDNTSLKNVNLPLVRKRVPETRFDLFYITFQLMILVTVTQTNVEEKPAGVEQQPLLMDDKEKTHYKGMRLSCV